MVRLYSDVADMIGWIVKVEGGSAAQVVDPLIRPQIVSRYERIKPLVERIKKSQEEARQQRAEEK